MGLSPDAEDALTSYAWPGSIRELSNVLGRAVHYAEHDRVDLSDLPRYFFQKDKRPNLPAPEPLRPVQHSAEKEALRRALEAASFNKARAARMLGIHRSLFYKKLKKYGIALQPEATGRT